MPLRDASAVGKMDTFGSDRYNTLLAQKDLSDMRRVAMSTIGGVFLQLQTMEGRDDALYVNERSALLAVWID
jgi:hypothetical protein